SERLLERDPNQAIADLAVVANQAKPGRNLLQIARLRRDVHAASVAVVLETVVGTDDVAVANLAHRDLGASMEAEVFERRDAIARAKDNDALVEETNRDRCVSHVGCISDRMPVPTKWCQINRFHSCSCCWTKRV